MKIRNELVSFGSEYSTLDTSHLPATPTKLLDNGAALGVL